MSKPAAIPIGLLKSFPNICVLKIGSFLFSSNTFETKLNFKEIVSKHLETNFFVYMIGFVPGQPFLGDLNEDLYHDRLDTPRIRINKGSVGIVEKFCTIYTFESPGGWNIIGRTPFELFNINKTNTSILSPGDTVKFKSISKKEFTLFKNE